MKPPREPTTEMMLAGMEVQDREGGQDTAGVWRAMWDAAVDRVLAYKPKPKSKPARKRARRAKKLAKA